MARRRPTKLCQKSAVFSYHCRLPDSGLGPALYQWQGSTTPAVAWPTLPSGLANARGVWLLPATRLTGVLAVAGSLHQAPKPGGLLQHCCAVKRRTIALNPGRRGSPTVLSSIRVPLCSSETVAWYFIVIGLEIEPDMARETVFPGPCPPSKDAPNHCAMDQTAHFQKLPSCAARRSCRGRR